MKTIPILPCLGGEASRPDVSHADYQPHPTASGGMVPPKYMRGVLDCVITSDGAVKSRLGEVSVATIAGALSLCEFAGSLYIHTAGAVETGGLLLRRVISTGVTTTIATGFSRIIPLSWCEHQNTLRITDGTEMGRITPAGVLIPALPQAAAPVVTTTFGTLPAGLYLVSYTWLDSTGAESGCAASTSVSLDGTKSLVVALPAVIPAGVASVRLWCSRANEGMLSLVGDYLTSQFPKTITAEPTPTVTLKTAGLVPMPPGAGLTTRGGFLVSWAGSLLSFSHGTWSHLYNPLTDIIEIDDTILGCVGVDGGLWVTTANALYWIGGSDLSKASLVRTGRKRTYAKGGTLLAPGELGVETIREFAVFASDYGLVCGLSDGSIQALMTDSQKWDVSGKTAHFATTEMYGERQLLVTVN